MRLLENDVALVTILTLLLFSMVKFQEVPGDSTPVVQDRTGAAVEWRP